MAVETIAAFKTSDEQLFIDKPSADRHEDELRFKKAVEKFVLDNGFNGMSTQDLRDLIIDKRDELLEILIYKIGIKYAKKD